MVTESSALQGRNEEASQILVSPLIQKEGGYLHGLFSILNVSLFIIRDLFREGGLVAHLLDGPSFITRYFVVLVG